MKERAGVVLDARSIFGQRASAIWRAVQHRSNPLSSNLWAFGFGCVFLFLRPRSARFCVAARVVGAFCANRAQ
eukprot:9463745-Lingulodinium_polyedra.AAC.1